MIREGIIVCDRKEELYFSYARIKKYVYHLIKIIIQMQVLIMLS